MDVWNWVRNPREFAILSGFVVLWQLTAVRSFAADKVELSESANDKRAFRVSVSMELEGHVQTVVADGKAVALKLSGVADLSYYERRLPSLGRDAADFRGLRFYDKANFSSQVADRKSDTRLRQGLQQIVAEGQSDGVRMYCPHGPLTYEEAELIRPPVDSLTAVALLPADRVEVGETWQTPRWAYQFLTAFEAVEKGSLECKLESVEDNIARISMTGEVIGGILGAASQVRLTGHYLYDLKAQCLTRMELNQTENRAVGAASPGLQVTAKAVLTREAVGEFPALSDGSIAEIPRVPKPGTLLLMLESPEWGIKVYHDRLWHLFHQSSTVSVLRLMEKGTLVAQCNVSQIGAAPAGKHIAEKQFQQDVRTAIGPEFHQIEKAEVIPTQDKRYVLRVVSSGEAMQKTSKGVQKIPVIWIYYLVANPDGRQIVLIFTIEASLMERLKDRDVNLALGVDFLPKKSTKSGPEIKMP
ncbi:MAG: hypothetical protein JWM11_2713 [Planctomycetaceae bacterium]|nr:hypothetical protein [Planctomycetaceae bacterium]